MNNTKNNEQRDAIYARTGRRGEAGDEAIQSQLAACRKGANAEAVEYVALGCSGSGLGCNTELERLRKDIAAGQVKRVFVQSYDRLGRGHILLAIMLHMENQGCEVISATEGPCSGFRAAALVIAQTYREAQSTRIKMGLKRKRDSQSRTSSNVGPDPASETER